MSRRSRAWIPFLLAAAMLAGCGQQSSLAMERLNDKLTVAEPDDKNRTTYEIFVGSFADSNGDGIGDLNGITQKLDYINGEGKNAGSGFNAIWLTPICEATSYHKYDTIDYEKVDPDFGTIEDFDSLIEACHERGIDVYTDMVMNHTSVEHPWFKEAASYLRNLPADREPDVKDCPYVDYYNFTKDQKDGYSKLAGTDWYYEARFWEGMPDLNLDSDAVRGELTDIAQFWIDHGVDGFRLDATTSYYTDSSKDTIAFLKWYNGMVKEKKPDAYLVGEAWTDQETYAEYYSSGVDSFFDFAYSGPEGLIAKMAKGKIDAVEFGKGLEEEEELYTSYNPDAVNAPFYTNHDLARSAGYYSGDASSRVKLADALNLLMTGNAFVYYGEEIGMKGSGKDENKRAPMYWTGDEEDADEDADLICDPPENMDKVEMKYPSAKEQEEDPLSILNYYRNAEKIRNAYPAISRGRTQVIDSLSGETLLVFTRDDPEGTGTVLVIINTAEEAAVVDLDGADLNGMKEPHLSAALQTTEENPTQEKTKVTIPAFGIVVLAE
ncbi:MAG: alpha-amylase family glycosyl hydrolase [Eubacterium sp.]|nr:alpha-amylase family glycosyl hydrolase [Eubacterium sp.]